MSDFPDRRLHAFRADLADLALKGQVNATRFAEGMPARIKSAVVLVRKEPKPSASVDTEFLFGEDITVFDRADGWAWVQSGIDWYVGYVPVSDLDLGAPPPATHRVHALRSFVYPEPNMKMPPLLALSLGSRLAVAETEGKWAKLATGGFIYSRHISPLTSPETDPIAVAERFRHIPYLWGGRSSFGLDCSALIQLSMDACNIPCPRDSDMQESGFGTPVPFTGDQSVLERGDLIFWRGHVAFWLDPTRCLHANATDMMVAEAPFEETVARIETAGEGPVTSVRRPPKPPALGHNQ